MHDAHIDTGGRMTLADILIKDGRGMDHNLKEALMCVSDFIEEMRHDHGGEVNDLLIKAAGYMDGCHFSQHTADHVISMMEPVGMGNDDLRARLPSPSAVQQGFKQAYERARTKARAKGFEAPQVPSSYNPYDLLVTYAMCLADYHLIADCDEQLYDIAYAFIADPDYKGDSKIWRYIVY